MTFFLFSLFVTLYVFVLIVRFCCWVFVGTLLNSLVLSCSVSGGTWVLFQPWVHSIYSWACLNQDFSTCCCWCWCWCCCCCSIPFQKRRGGDTAKYRQQFFCNKWCNMVVLESPFRLFHLSFSTFSQQLSIPLVHDLAPQLFFHQIQVTEIPVLPSRRQLSIYPRHTLLQESPGKHIILHSTLCLPT